MQAQLLPFSAFIMPQIYKIIFLFSKKKCCRLKKKYAILIKKNQIYVSAIIFFLYICKILERGAFLRRP